MGSAIPIRCEILILARPAYRRSNHHEHFSTWLPCLPTGLELYIVNAITRFITARPKPFFAW